MYTWNIDAIRLLFIVHVLNIMMTVIYQHYYVSRKEIRYFLLHCTFTVMHRWRMPLYIIYGIPYFESYICKIILGVGGLTLGESYGRLVYELSA